MRLFLKQWKQIVSKKKMSKNLAVFDFDHTVINDNSDIVAMNMVDHSKIPKELKQLHKSDGWTAFMQGVFDILYKNNIREKSIYNVMKSLKPVPGMPDLIKELNQNMNFDVIVISDSNSYFIETWIKANDLDRNILRVFTNPARFENGALKIEMYHFQDTCKLSTKNLCKGKIMEEFIEAQKKKGYKYETVIYCGDGMNDFCPILRLGEKDIACVREKFKCVDVVLKSKKGQYIDEDGQRRIVKSDICVWKNGFDIIDFIKQKNIGQMELI